MSSTYLVFQVVFSSRPTLLAVAFRRFPDLRIRGLFAFKAGSC